LDANNSLAHKTSDGEFLKNGINPIVVMGG